MATQKENPILNYVAQAAQAAAANKQAQIDTALLMDEQETAQQEQVTQARAAGKARVAVIAGTEAIAASTDAEKALIVEKFGTTYSDQASESNFWATEMKVNGRKAYESQDKLKELQGKDFMSDPLGFISAQFALPAAAAEFNYFANKHNTAQANLTSITQASDAAVIAASRAAKTTSTELAIAKGEEAAALNATQVSELIARNAGTRIQGIGALNNLSNQQLSQAFQLHSAQNSDRSLAMQAQSLAQQAKMRQLALDEAKERLDAKNAMLEDIKYEMDAYNAGARRTGKMTFDSIERFRSAYKANQNSPEFINTMSSGKLLVLNKGVTNGIMVADNAGEAAMIYSTGQAVTPVAKFLKQQVLDVKQNVNAPKDRVGFIGSVSNVAVERAGKQAKRIDQNSPETNIYAAPPASVILQSRAVDLPFINEMVRPMLEADPNAKIPDAVLVEKAVEYAKMGRGNFNDAAASITSYYRQAVLTNKLTNQYIENGLPEQKNYPAVLNGKIVDLTDPIQVKRMLLSRTAPTLGLFSAQNMVENQGN